MATRTDPPGAVTAAGLTVALAVVVAVASHDAPAWAMLRAGAAERREILFAVAALWVLGLAAAFAITLAAHRAGVARRPGAPPIPTRLVRALPPTTIVLSVLALLLIAEIDPRPGSGGSEEAGRLHQDSDRRPGGGGLIDHRNPNVVAGEGEPDGSGVLGDDETWDRRRARLILLLAFAAAAGGAAWLWHSRRSASSGAPHGPDSGEAPDQDAVHGTVLSTIDAMLKDPDPSTAIRGAYARLLEGLDACGTGRRDYEAPMEHLRRVLAILRVRPEPARHLTSLFQIARFSTHPLTASHREQALDALRTVATDLAPASRAGAGAGGGGLVSHRSSRGRSGS